MKLEPFTQKRLCRFVEDFRGRTGQLPTKKDFETAGFTREMLDQALKLKLIEEFFYHPNQWERGQGV